MIDSLQALTDQVHGLMRANAATLDDIEQLRREHARATDAFVRDVLEVLDSLERAVGRLADPEARDVVASIAYQTQLLLEARGMLLVEFARGELPPLEEVQVLATARDESLPELAVLRMLHRGLRDGPRIVRKAGVELNKL